MSIKLLVADDSITIQKVIGIIFGGEEYSLTVVDNGKTAIEKAREICPDVLLIDALMPGMTGYEVAEAIRATPALSNKPILILTGSFEPFDEDKARKCGADDFLAKPFESQQIINKVKELSELGIARGNSAAPTQQPEVPAASVIPEAGPASSPFAESFTDAVPQQEIVPPVPQTSTDIWNAFTFEPETQEPAPAISAAAGDITSTVQSVPPQDEPDVFSIVNEESGSAFIQAEETVKAPVQNIGSQWVPVEENTFEFEEEQVPSFTPPTAAVQPEPLITQSFGDISFEDDEPESTPSIAPVAAVPVIEPPAEAFKQPIETDVFTFEEPISAFAQQPDTPAPAPAELPQAEFMAEAVVAVVPEADQTAVTTVSEAAPAVLSEEQLRAALSSASKEVIERIVWEVVPDLAEALIKEAIRKIKEGI